MTRSKYRTRALVSIGATTSLLLLTACGSDDDGSASTEAACETWIAADDAVIGFLFAGQGDEESVNAALDAAIESAPDDNVDTLTSLKEEAGAQFADPESDASEETLQLYSDAIAWAGESCDDAESIDVVATEYHFEGIPEEATTGYKVINFSNEGQEAHEIFTFRINEGVTESVEELLALPEEEVMGKITPVNAGFAMPGTSSAVSWNLAEPGNYAAICFVSVGSVGETEGDGPPHFTEGMIHEFKVA